MKRSHLILILVLGIFFRLQSQSTAESWIDRNVWPESPTASTIREVTSPQPALLTGAASFSIPVHTLIAEDLSIPFAFSYHSNGIKITDDPCPWGYGWSLTPSIRLTRRIMGRPDGLFKSVNDYHPGQFLSHNLSYHCMVDSMVGSSVTMHSDFYLDATPDIFTAQLADSQFSFMYINGEAVTASHKEYTIHADELLQNFTIIDPHGYIYKFDIHGERCGSNQNLTEWLPSSIICPSGREILFSYINCESAVRNSQEKNPKVYTWKKYPVQSVETGNILYSHPDFWGCQHLSSVTFSGEKIAIGYSGTDGKRNLESIKVIHGSVTTRTFTFTYSDNLPKKITTPDGDYSLEYDSHTFNEGSGRDWWGYPNGKPQSKDDQLGAPRISIQIPGLNSVITHSGSNRNIDEEEMQACMLRKVTFPTGGTAEWEYETHRFAPINSMSSGISYIKNPVTLDKGGGLRVVSVTLRNGSADTTPRVTRYVYGHNGDGLANCVCAPTLETFVEVKELINVSNQHNIYDHYTFLGEYSSINIYRNSRYMENMVGVTPIWYSQVEEIHPEGKTVYKFEDICDEDEMIDCDGFTRLPILISRAFSSGPTLTETTVYKEENGIYTAVSKEEREYNLAVGPAVYGYSIFRKLNCTDRAINCSWPDFSGTLSVIFEVPSIVGGDGQHWETYTYSESSIYLSPLLTIAVEREELANSKTTEYFQDGSRTITETYTYLPETSLPDSTVSSTSAESITTSYRYPSHDSSDAIEREMAERGMYGVSTSQTISYGSHSITTVAHMQKYGSVFRPTYITTIRDDGTPFESPSYTWNRYGALQTCKDKAGVETYYTWDGNSRYPLTMTTGNLITKATWKSGVGVSSLTAADGVMSVYSYDAKGRLVTEGISGYGTIKKWNYNISQAGANYVREYTLRKADDTTPPYTQINYDFLGRPVSSIRAITDALSAWQYCATATVYDSMGRPCRSYPSSPVTGAAPSASDVAAAAVEWYGESYPYELTEYEPSPRNLTIASIKAGEAWHSSVKKRTLRKYTNDMKNKRCFRLSVTEEGGIALNGYYQTGALDITESVDEDGILTITYTDLRGKTILEERGGFATRYVYNDFGDLRFILPPGLTARPYNADDSDLLALGFSYTYDNKGRMISSRRPGCPEAKYVYDNANRIVAENNPNLGNKWRLHYYDGNGREILIMETGKNPSTVIGLTEAKSTAATTTIASSKAGYKPAAVPDDAEVYLAYYYDNYNILRLLRGPQSGPAEDGSNMQTPLGHLTGIYTGAGYEIIQYDAIGREIRRDATGYADGTILYSYGYRGEVLTERAVFPSRYNLPDRVISTDYDDEGKPIVRKISLGTSTASFTWTYDKIGRPSASSHGLMKRTYSFDVHGWPTKITTRYRQNNLSTLFTTLSETMRYDSGSTPRYNGFVSSHIIEKGRYDFAYDTSGRLTEAEYTAQSGDENHSTSYSYDSRGNMLSLKRYGIIDRTPAGKATYGLMDDLSASYTGNLIKTITSYISSVSIFAGRSGASLKDGDYALQWDEAGRLKYDASRALVQILYNTQGLMTSVRKSSGDLQSYTYDNMGRKMSAEYLTVRTGAIQRRNYFASGLETYGDSVETIRFPGGYFDAERNPHYFATDYQGNNVLIVDKNSVMEKSYRYYPYGEPVERPTATFGQATNRHLYGDKEYLNSFGEATYDLTARSYSPSVIPFFTTQDPMGDAYAGMSPYAYCASNPVVNVDPSGCRIEGISKDDADYLVNDFQTIFSGDEFEKFRKLIVRDGKKQNKKNLAPISQDALQDAFEGVTLTDDQTALVDMFVRDGSDHWDRSPIPDNTALPDFR